MNWSLEKIKDRYQYLATEADRYKNEIKSSKVARDPAYKSLYDEQLAKSFLYNSLVDKLFLENRETLIHELTRLLTTKQVHDEILSSVRAYDDQRFLTAWNQEIQSELQRLENQQVD
jgi:hypothetical protein